VTLSVITLIAKSLLAVVLIVAGAAKASELSSFTSTVRLFLPRAARARAAHAVAVAIVVAELVLGAGSLMFQGERWIGVIVFATACTFVLASIYGYVHHRGRSCTCFGALSSRRFDGFAIARSVGLASVGAVAILNVQASAVALTMVDRLLVLISAAIVALSSATASRALLLGRQATSEGSP
jgi:hypothetical protein